MCIRDRTRRGFSDKDKSNLKKAYRYIFRSDLNQSDAINRINEEFSEDKNIKDVVNFFKSSKRGII